MRAAKISPPWPVLRRSRGRKSDSLLSPLGSYGSCFPAFFSVLVPYSVNGQTWGENFFSVGWLLLLSLFFLCVLSCPFPRSYGEGSRGDEVIAVAPNSLSCVPLAYV